MSLLCFVVVCCSRLSLLCSYCVALCRLSVLLACSILTELSVVFLVLSSVFGCCVFFKEFLISVLWVFIGCMGLCAFFVVCVVDLLSYTVYCFSVSRSSLSLSVFDV